MLRLDRFLTLALFRHLARTDGKIKLRIPILMYHGISCNKEKGVHPYYRLNTSPLLFAVQMQFLSDRGYRVITLDEAIDTLNPADEIRGSETERVAVITFDDGFLDFYTEALPVLKRFDFKATVFLPTSFIKEINETSRGQNFLSWPQVRELADTGISFGSHSVTHRYLAELSREQIEQELRVSKETIEQQTGKAVRTFSYPYAYPENEKEFVSFMRDTIKSSGYCGAVTTRIGTVFPGDDLFSLKRIPINSEDDEKLFMAKMVGNYDWLYTAQYMVKAIKGKMGIRRRKILATWDNS